MVMSKQHTPFYLQPTHPPCRVHRPERQRIRSADPPTRVSTFHSLPPKGTPPLRSIQCKSKLAAHNILPVAHSPTVPCPPSREAAYT